MTKSLQNANAKKRFFLVQMMLNVNENKYKTCMQLMTQAVIW